MENSRKLYINLILLGILSWLIPFAVSFLFYNKQGELIVPYSTFKSSIMALGTMTGCYLLYRYFRLVNEHFVQSGILVGFCWLVMNLILDTAILVPIMKITIANYLTSIGLSYLSIPAISVSMGYLLKLKGGHT